MKTILILLCLMIGVYCEAQEWFNIWHDTVYYYEFDFKEDTILKLYFSDGGYVEFEPPKEINLYWYEKYCKQLDTIITQYEPNLELFIIKHNQYLEAYTEEQLESMGYKYKYRWIYNLDSLDIDYYFIEEPTLKGFVQWLITQ